MKIGFIGQGYIGKNYADDFEQRGYDVIRYSLEAEYIGNKDLIKDCDIVFIAVPTPTTPNGSDISLIKETLKFIGDGKCVVIKSTLVPGTTQELQKEFSHIFIFHSPEFLSRATAKEDALKPKRNIIGVAVDSDVYRQKAEKILELLPKAPYELITISDESELIKYINNTFFYTKTVFMNLMYDVASAHGCSWDRIKEAMRHEPWIGENHIDPIHRSGRGAGGPCLIKDFKAFILHYEEIIGDTQGISVLKSLEQKNLKLLQSTGKDADELRMVYGKKDI